MSKLSTVDRQILDLLQKEGDLSAGEIGERVGLSQSPCWRRINKMQEDGIICGKQVLLNRSKLNLKVAVFASVRLNSHGWEHLESFEKAIENLPEVVEVYTTAGSTDYLLKIVISSIEDYQHFLREKILHLPYIKEMHSQITMSEVKYTTELPLNYCES